MPTNNTRYTVSGKEHAPVLGVSDWNEEWKQLQDIRRKSDRSEYWNKRAKDFDRPDTVSPYVQALIERAALEPSDTVLDMGCGTGSVALPLARAGHQVIAADFSDGMIEEAQRRFEAAGASSIETHIMAWEDDWESFGLGENSIDVVIASRSLAVYDLAAALDKMTSTARKRCIATMSCGQSPRMDSRILAACGLERQHGRDYQYAWNILTNKGYHVDCSFIYSTRKDTFESAEAAYDDFKRMIDDVDHLYPASKIEQAYTLLQQWLEKELVDNEEAGHMDEKGYPQGALRLREARVIPWAYLEWQV
ncbi:MAG: methyltransferase domain-containing protein [Eggerthellaceae bacterium]|nr:methyltransferase domain-containing protein [Eggerthellaceae bacterium]